MIVVLRRVACALLATLATGSTLWAQNPPPPLTAPVNDFANVIDSEDEAALDSLIRRLQSASGDALVVATVKTFAPAPDIRVYANEMFENRGKGIGQKGRDNGLLLLLAVDDREVWSEVGYDLEGIITDGFAGETSRQVMVPFFKQGNYGDGLVAGATRFAQRIAQARNVALDGVPMREPVSDDEFPLVLIIFAGIILINIVRAAMNRAVGGTRRRGRRRWSSSVGPFGAGYGGWSSGGGSWSSGGGGGFGGGFGGFGGGRSGGGGGGASW